MAAKELNISDVSAIPEIIFLFSGKRKSGKDYITDKLHERIGADRSVVVKISGPIKSHWAKTMGLDLEGLLGDGKYKEKYRLEMTKWGEELRKKDHGYFCRAAIDMYNARSKNIWIVSDIRRRTDIQWFRQNYGTKCRTICVSSSLKTREERGWTFAPGIDDSETECDLDGVEDWDLTIFNENDSNADAILADILGLLE